MEHNLKVLLGTFIFSILLIIFYSLFDRVYRSLSTPSSKSPTSPIPLILNRKNSKSNDSGFIYEEYSDSSPVCILLSDESSSLGIGLFPPEHRIETFVSQREVSPYDLISIWATEWARIGKPSVHIILDDRTLVNTLNNDRSTYWDRLEDTHGFRVMFHWTDNFFIDEGFNEELWDELIVLGRSIKKHGDHDMFWRDFVCGHWHRTEANTGLPNTGKLIDLS